MINGIDVSQYQGEVSWSEVRKTQDFAFVRAMPLAAFDGPTVTYDTHFRQNWWGAKTAGMLAGPYTFARMDIDPTRFAVAFLDVLSTVGYGSLGDLPPVIDVEAPPAASPHRLAHDSLTTYARMGWVAEVLDEIEAATGRTAIVYTGLYYWRDSLAATERFKDRPLWLARYRTAITQLPEQPWGWPSWSFWQWTSGGNMPGFPSVPGVPGRVDLNAFNGSRADLYRL